MIRFPEKQKAILPPKPKFYPAMKTLSLARNVFALLFPIALTQSSLTAQIECPLPPNDCVVTPPWFVLDADFRTEIVTNDSKCCDLAWDNICSFQYLQLVNFPEDWDMPYDDPRPSCATDCEAVRIVLSELPVCHLDWTALCRMRYSELSNSCLNGCTDPFGCNYNPAATLNDNTCDYTCRCPCDLNGDGMVNLPDLHIVLGHAGCSGQCQGDLNNDGQVNFADIVIFNSHFGSPCF
jgi:hypothetical protein